ncbi:tRNA wybutosine-synthesizing protein 2 homolog isoform X3 [Zalophus californianus]|uniref:tRNA wybutosine-synthesizing protein 2 homolog isoform X3 n=1 Tax=Zalophus californianus TaxID=9704 RepID=A0A6J2EF10_ZALCA|nr:tRNA wybutosine-synthesizing protein 2 homolog isoform X3 [Zalophus californianus]
MRESRGSLGNERMRSAQIQVVTIAEEMGRIQKVPDCSPAQGLPYEIHCLVAGQGVSWSAELEEDFPCSWQWHGDLLLLNEDCFQTKHWGKLEPELWETVAVTRGIQGLAKRRTQSRIPHYIVVMSPLASVDCGSFAEFLCFDDLDGIEEYRSGIFLM